MNTRKAALDRRFFLGASGVDAGGRVDDFRTARHRALAQQQPAGAAKAAEAKKLTQVIAEFVTGFELRQAPPLVIDRARVAFIDTVGVMLAGSREPAKSCRVVKLEGARRPPRSSGQSLRTSPQLAALANGVAGHAMDYDFTYLRDSRSRRSSPRSCRSPKHRRDAGRSAGSLHRRLRGGRADFARQS